MSSGWIASVLKAAFGTNERTAVEPMPEPINDKLKEAAECGHGHVTEVLAAHTENKIDRMNAASDQLSRFARASNLTEALRQITG